MPRKAPYRKACGVANAVARPCRTSCVAHSRTSCFGLGERRGIVVELQCVQARLRTFACARMSRQGGEMTSDNGTARTTEVGIDLAAAGGIDVIGRAKFNLDFFCVSICRSNSRRPIGLKGRQHALLWRQWRLPSVPSAGSLSGNATSNCNSPQTARAGVSIAAAGVPPRAEAFGLRHRGAQPAGWGARCRNAARSGRVCAWRSCTQT